LPAAFLAAFAAFLGDFFAPFLPPLFVDDELFPPEKIVSQLSEYCFVAPMRTTLIVQLFSEFKNQFTTDVIMGTDKNQIFLSVSSVKSVVKNLAVL
jgi:hypothetical protein